MTMFKENMKGFDGVNFEYNPKDKMRKEKEIALLAEIMFDRIWYERALCNPCEQSEEPRRKIVEKYGEEFLSLSEEECDFDWGYLNGVLATLRWVLGDEMDNLDS